MNLTEEMLSNILPIIFINYLNVSSLVKQVTGGYKITAVKPNGDPIEIDFTPPFKRISIVEELRKHLGEIPNFEDEGIVVIVVTMKQLHWC